MVFRADSARHAEGKYVSAPSANPARAFLKFKITHMQTTDILKWLLPVYCFIYFGLSFIVKSLLTARKIGKSPLVLPKDDTAYGLIGFYFKCVTLALLVYVLFFAFVPQWHLYYLPLWYLQSKTVFYAGCMLLLLALIWTFTAQVHMRDSWRIGIDTKDKTALVTGGLFRLSRNPIFLGMIMALLGLFLINPNVLTLVFFISGYILIQIQVRLEEVFLLEQHGTAYSNYCTQVRRFI
jgi:protein-S-isoprenylcysteine O-methyltransferase Ste14